jgi:WD40 repeat protein
MKLRSKTIRVFLSSTFEDLKMERDALQKKAFKNLREHCREKGWQFQAVDLRWGINNEATIDQRTMEICLREIARCQEQSPRPNFIVLLGERYGWRPLPDRILQSVAREMEKQMPAALHGLFKQWYELDENQLPEPVWKLRSREGRYIDYNEYDKTIQKPLIEFFTNWAAENLPDPEQIENSTDPLALQRLSMERSATEQEIHAGAFRVEDAQEHVFAFFRNLPECPAENTTYHDSDQQPVQRLRSHLKNYLQEENISEFPAGWNKEKNQPDDAHLEQLSEEVEDRLKAIIDREMESYQLTDDHEIEQAAHEAFARERTFGFSGREKDIAAICEYATQDHQVPFVVWGESGTGKSTLLARTAGKLQESLPQAHVITRFIGVTGKSSNGHTLLADVCKNLCLFYGGEVAEIPEDPAKLQYAFRDYLAKATEEHPLVLIIDALDQLNESDPARQLQWLPQVLPPNVIIITSTLKVDCFHRLKERENPAPLFYEITPLTATDGRYALDAWLKRANRTLQPHQREQIIRNFEYAGCAPLYLHLAFEQAQHWESFARRQHLGRDIPEMIEEFYGNLSRPEAHGSIVEKVLTAIRCAKQGLSDDELLGVLAADDDFWNSFGIQTYHSYDNGEKTEAASRLVPPVLWIRLYHDLEYYLTRRNAPGGEVITFYHRQLAEAVDNIYLMRPGLKQRRHKELADYFAGKKWLRIETPPIIANVRKCDELPWQRIKSEDWDAVTDTLCNLDFIQAKAAAKMTYDLVNDFNAALQVIPDNAENICKEKERQARMDKYTQDLIACAEGKLSIEELKIPESSAQWSEEQIDVEIERIKTNPNQADRLTDFTNFLGQEANNLQNYALEFPHFATQQAWNFSNGGPIGIAAKNNSTESCKFLLMRKQSSRPPWNPKPQAIKTMKGHSSSVIAVAIIPDGKQAVSGSRDNTCILWDLNTGQPIKTLNGHSSSVNAIAITPDGKQAVSGSKDNTCILWDLNIGQPIKTLNGHFSSVRAVAITADGKRAISGSKDKTCILWDLNTGQPVKTLIGHTSYVNSVAITPNGKQAVSGSIDKTCILWDLNSGKPIKTLKGHSDPVIAVAITPDGKQAVSGSSDKTCILWDLNSGKPIKSLKGHSSVVWAVAITTDGKHAISGSNDNTCIVWDLTSGQPIKTLKGHSFSVMAVSITPDGKQAISGSRDNTCILWDLNTGQPVKTLKGHSSSVWVVAITPDGKQAVSGSWDKTCILWDLNTGQPIKTLIGHTDFVNAVAITPDGKQAVSGSKDETCILWDLNTGQPVKTLIGHNIDVLAVAITLDGKQAISCSWDNICILWDLNTGQPVKTLIGHTDSVDAVAITPDGRQALSGSWDNTCILWDLNTGQPIKTLIGHTSGVIAVAITPDGKQAISASNDKTCILWDLITGQTVKILIGHTDSVDAVAITPDGKQTVSGSWDKTCILWNLNTGQPIKTLIGHTSGVDAVAITPDGKQAVSGSWDNTCILWDLNTGQPIKTLIGHTSGVIAVAITPDGKQAVSGSWDKTCILWDLNTGNQLARSAAGSNINAVTLYENGILLGCNSGEVNNLNVNEKLLRRGEAITNIRQIWEYELQQYQELSADCPLCGHRFSPPVSVLETIEKITKEAGLNPEQSPCLDLPDEAWKEPGLLGNCPKCGENLKFNPFVAGGD